VTFVGSARVVRNGLRRRETPSLRANTDRRENADGDECERGAFPILTTSIADSDAELDLPTRDHLPRLKKNS
jgi:hypothetical protein